MRRPVLILLCFCSLSGFTQESRRSWQGNAAVARSGEFDAPGFFAASNAFPQNTNILVRNAQTGRSVHVTVVRRLPGGSLFLLLSEEAGKQIGLNGSEVIRVEVNEISPATGQLRQSLREDAYTRDSDLNPAVSVAEQQVTAPEEPSRQAAAEIAQAGAEKAGPTAAESLEPGQSEEPAGQPPAGQPEAPEQPETAQAEESVAQAEAQPGEEPEASPEEKRLRELQDRIPQKQLYMPPRQQEIYALGPESEPVEREELAEIPGEQAPGEQAVEELPQEMAETAAEEPEVSMPGPAAAEEPLDVALPGPEAAEPEKPRPEGTRLPVPEEESPLAMQPEEPPTGHMEAAAEQPEEAAAEQAAILPSRTYFVQLGAYSTRGLAERLAADLEQTYTVTILPAGLDGRRYFKVLVGPLNVDESGTLLYQFRSRGFKDAFIQFVE
jgi:rare lipoprotein A (peptidoglycan hydrolase)